MTVDDRLKKLEKRLDMLEVFVRRLAGGKVRVKKEGAASLSKK